MDLYVPFAYSVWSVVGFFAYHPRADAMGVHLNPHFFHLTSLLLHTISALAAFEILRRCVRDISVATLGALLFALHPLQVEPVAWAAGMKDVLAGMLALVAIWQYTVIAQLAKPTRGRWHWMLGTAAFILAMLSKPSAVVTPAIAWVIDVLLISRNLRHATRRAIPWLILAIPCIIWTRIFQPAPFIGDAIPLYYRPLIAGDALTFYLFKIVFPVNLAVDYVRTPQFALSQGWVYVAWVVPVILGASAWYARRRATALTAAFCIFVIALAPVLGIIPFDFQAYSTVADHYMYLAMLGPALALAWLASRSRRQLTIPVAVGMIVVAAVLSRLQTRHWSDTHAIFSHAIQVTPRSWVSHHRLAEFFSLGGDYTTALRHAEQAAANNDRAWPAYTIMADILSKLGRAEEAAAAFRTAQARFAEAQKPTSAPSAR